MSLIEVKKIDGMYEAYHLGKLISKGKTLSKVLTKLAKFIKSQE